MTHSTPGSTRDMATEGTAGASFTPGEWEAVLQDDPRGQPVPYYRGLVALVECSPKHRLAVVTKDGSSVDLADLPAIACLLAASPTMLAELETTCGLLNALLMWIDGGFAKATFGTTGASIRGDIQERVEILEALISKARGE